MTCPTCGADLELCTQPPTTVGGVELTTLHCLRCTFWMVAEAPEQRTVKRETFVNTLSAGIDKLSFYTPTTVKRRRRTV